MCQPAGVVEPDEEEDLGLVVVDIFESIGIGVVVMVVGNADCIDRKSSAELRDSAGCCCVPFRTEERKGRGSF